MKKSRTNFAVYVTLGLIFVFVLLFLKGDLVLSDKKENKDSSVQASSKPVVYLLPHQDDEMFMAGQIKSNLEAGREVYVAIVTDGGASIVRNQLNGRDENGKKVYAPIDKKYHNPTEEGYAPLDRQAFAKARNVEMYHSLRWLGVSPDHIIFVNPGGIHGSANPTYRDGELTVLSATEAIKNVFKIVGDGVYYTVGAQLGSINAIHGDHRMLRDALVYFSGITEKHYFSEKVGRGTGIDFSLEMGQAKYGALGSYYIWDPPRGNFAIARHSVESLINQWRKMPVEFVMSQAEILEQIKNEK